MLQLLKSLRLSRGRRKLWYVLEKSVFFLKKKWVKELFHSQTEHRKRKKSNKRLMLSSINVFDSIFLSNREYEEKMFISSFIFSVYDSLWVAGNYGIY